MIAIPSCANRRIGPWFVGPGHAAGDAMRNLYRRDNIVLARRVDVGVLRVVRNVLQAQARSCASVADARPRVSGRINWRRDQ